MTILTEEIPFTNEAIKIYINETEKRMDVLRVHVSEFNRLKTRLKLSQERLEKHKQTVDNKVKV